MKPLLLGLIFFLLLVSIPYGHAETQPSIVSLTNAKNQHRLSLSFLMPQGWAIEWYSEDSTSSIARVFRLESGGMEAIVIAASPLGNIPPGKIFEHDEFRKIAQMLNASIQQPDASINWKGVRLEYPLPPKVKSSPFKIDVKNWFTTSDGRLVQFQCYYVFDPQLSAEKQAEVHNRTELEYLKILQSLKVSD